MRIVIAQIQQQGGNQFFPMHTGGYTRLHKGNRRMDEDLRRNIER